MFNWKCENFELSNFEQNLFIRIFLLILLNNLNKDSDHSGYFNLSCMKLVVLVLFPLYFFKHL